MESPRCHRPAAGRVTGKQRGRAVLLRRRIRRQRPVVGFQRIDMEQRAHRQPLPGGRPRLMGGHHRVQEGVRRDARRSASRPQAWRFDVDAGALADQLAAVSDPLRSAAPRMEKRPLQRVPAVASSLAITRNMVQPADRLRPGRQPDAAPLSCVRKNDRRTSLNQRGGHRHRHHHRQPGLPVAGQLEHDQRGRDRRAQHRRRPPPPSPPAHRAWPPRHLGKDPWRSGRRPARSAPPPSARARTPRRPCARRW